MKWIDVIDQEIPKDRDVLVIWKGRIGILHWDSETKPFCAICPYEFTGIMEMDDQCFSKINYWMECPPVIYRCDQPTFMQSELVQSEGERSEHEMD